MSKVEYLSAEEFISYLEAECMASKFKSLNSFEQMAKRLIEVTAEDDFASTPVKKQANQED